MNVAAQNLPTMSSRTGLSDSGKGTGTKEKRYGFVHIGENAEPDAAEDLQRERWIEAGGKGGDGAAALLGVDVHTILNAAKTRQRLQAEGNDPRGVPTTKKTGLKRQKADEDEDKRNTTTVRILKNRYAGLTGAACYLKYDRVTGRMTEVAAPKDVDDDF